MVNNGKIAVIPIASWQGGYGSTKIAGVRTLTLLTPRHPANNENSMQPRLCSHKARSHSLYTAGRIGLDGVRRDRIVLYVRCIPVGSSNRCRGNSLMLAVEKENRCEIRQLYLCFSSMLRRLRHEDREF